MNNEIPIYDVQLTDDTLGLTAVSLVDQPAIMENWVAFGDRQMMFLASKEKREVVSPLLIPDQLILRQAEDGSLYYIRWKRETILQAAERYVANGWFNNFTYMHPYFYNKDMKYEDTFEKDIYMLRLWTIENEKTDDANVKYGFNLPEGTLMCHFKVHNRKLWQKIKNKEVMGCSIEAFTQIAKESSMVSQIIKENNKVKLDKMDISQKQLNLFQKFIKFMNEVTEEADAIADIVKNDETNSGDISIKYYIDDSHYIEIDSDGVAKDEQGNNVAEGKYLLADGNYIIIDADGKFVETEPEDVTGNAETVKPEEAPIAENKLETEEKKENEEGENQGEGDGNGSESATEADNEDGEKSDEVGEENDGTVTEEETVEEPVALVPFEINGVEYQLPQEVVDFINSLLGENETIQKEIDMMKNRTPSASPIIASNGKQNNETMGLSEALRLLNR